MKQIALPLALLGAVVATPASAQDENTKINQVFLAEGEECPQSTENTIVVCGRLDDPYRIPKELRQSNSRAAEPFSERVSSYEIMTDTGIQSCSPVGSGGELGCTQELIRKAYGERAAADSVRFAELIEEARAERLSTIDEDAAETQARVEELEAEYMRKLEAERRGDDPDSAPLPQPASDNPALETQEEPEG